MSVTKVLENNGMLTVVFPKKLTAENAKAVNEEIINALKEKNTNEFEVDAENFTYVSSAGLRVLLELQKQGYKFEIKNVGQELYGILDLTGFNRLFTVRRKMREVSIDGLKCIGIGATSKVYRLDKDKIIKVFTHDYTLKEIEREMDKSKETFLKGINTPVSYDIVQVGDTYGTIYELIDAITLSEELDAHPDNEDKLIREYTDFVKAMDDIVVDKEMFVSAKEYYSMRIKQVQGDTPDYVVEDMLSVINEIPDADYFVHSDFHPKNVMYRNGEYMLIDMGGTIRGNHIFDLMGVGTLRIHVDMVPDEFAVMFAGMHKEQVYRFWNKFIGNYVNTDNEELIKKFEKVTLCYSALRSWLVCSVVSDFPKALKEHDIEAFEKYKKETEAYRSEILDYIQA